MRLLVPFSFSVRARAWIVLGAAAAFFAAGAPACADDGPFQMEPSSWMSFDRYKENPSAWVTPDRRAEAVTTQVVAPPPVMPPALPVIKTLDRSVAPPVMPAFNRGYDVRVDSTSDDNSGFVSELDDPSKPATSGLRPDWESAAKAARAAAEGTTDDKNRPLDIRLSLLPPLIAPLEKPAPIPTKAAEAKAKLPPAAAPPAADPAVCAAIDAYKKRQLAAIESDRKTLTALQNAIAQLGLKKQLDFLANPGSKLDMPASTASAIDLPTGKD